ncbi:hypothetical protein [Magnetospirillum moscoviense]|uniref:Antifreeze protein n=1 Tax=Magnetospirillum moscoviense TaxID=1437059 RepID=A0A178MNX4_9PROT|nr:hypothetical protein [Magnetospirillum moscoviense]OAN50396.1 hypothetical protein A6A05_12600 [Magnetospirillum moscoviense]
MTVCRADRRLRLLGCALALTLVPGLALAQSGRLSPLSQPFDPETMERIDPPLAEPVGKIDVNALKAPNPDGIGVLDSRQGGLPETLWANTSARTLRALIPLLPAASGSRALAGIERRLLLTAAPPPDDAREGEKPGLVELRAERLLAMGEVDGLLTLLKAVPAQASGPMLDRVRREAKLLGGDLTGACADAGRQAPDPSDPLQPKMLVLCNLTQGRTLEGNFGLDLLREKKDPDGAFITAAEVLGGVPAPALDKIRLDEANPLHVAAFAAAKLPLPASSLTKASASVNRAVALTASNPPELRLMAGERAEAAGALPIDSLRSLYLAQIFAPDEMSAPLTRADTAGPRARALLFRAATDQPDPVLKAQFAAKALELAGAKGELAGAARLFEPVILATRPDSLLAAQAPSFARALYALGKPEAAAKWLDIVQADPAAGATIAARLWPLAAIAGTEPGRELSLAGLAGWRQSLTGLAPELAARRVAVVLGTLAGLGAKIPDSLWLDTLALPAGGPKFGLFAMMQGAALDARLGGTVLAVLAATGDSGLDKLDPITLSEAISALSVVGLGEDARRLAVEAMLANGI